MWLNWPVVSSMPWRQRNAAVEAAVRELLGQKLASDPPWSTFELAHFLTLQDDPKLAQLLSKLARYMQGYATHDGEKIVRYGKQWQRWRWHGQKQEAADG